jgi:hypothetical protein
MTTCCLLLGTQVHEARYADEQASKIGGAQMDLPGEVAAGKRLTNAVYFAVGAAFFFFLMMVTSVSGFSDFDDPDLKPKILNVLTILFLVSFTIAMVQSCRWRTPNSGITHWKRVGLFALILWGGFPLIFVSFSILQSGALFGDVVVGMIPSLIWFPIWTGVSAIRGARSPERLTPMRAGAVTTSTNEPSPDEEAPIDDSKLRGLAGWLGMNPGTATPTLGQSDSTAVTESDAAPAPQASDPGTAETAPGAVGKSKRPNGWILGAIASGSLLVGVAITLVVMSAGQTPEQSAEQQAEVLAIKACEIVEATDDKPDTPKWTFTKVETDPELTAYENLQSFASTYNELVRYAVRATYLDDYWGRLASDLEAVDSFYVFYDDLVMKYSSEADRNILGKGFPDLDGETDEERDAWVEMGKDAIDRFEGISLVCNSLHDTLRERE